MSRRPIVKKQIAKLRRSMTMPLYASIDLVDWLQTRGHASTAGAARQLLIDGKVRSGSHVLGRTQIEKRDPLGKPVLDDDGNPELQWVPSPLVPASHRPNLICI